MLMNWFINQKRIRKNKLKKVDEVREQVRKILQDVDQKLILMARG